MGLNCIDFPGTEPPCPESVKLDSEVTDSVGLRHAGDSLARLGVATDIIITVIMGDLRRAVFKILCPG